MRVLVALLLCVALDANAIVRRHDRNDATYVARAKGLDAVVNMNLPRGAGTLIAPEWVLTAKHVTELIKLPHDVTAGGERVAIKRMIPHPKIDLALVQLATPAKARPAALYTARDEEGKEIVVAGPGFSGDGLTGPVDRDGVLRAATNRIDRALENWLRFRFDAPPEGTELEGISGPGDSGGPAFLDGKLAGVSSGQDDRATGKEGVYGVDEYYVRVSSYLDWIRVTMRGPLSCADVEAFHQFDFFIGDWSQQNLQGREVGRTRVEPVAGGCGLQETTTNPPEYAATAFHYFDPAAATWRQTYLDSRGEPTLWTGGFEGERLVYLREGAARVRSTFIRETADRVRQLFERSSDEGKTWMREWEGFYVRRTATATP